MVAAKTILILESNPWQDLSLNQEIRDLMGVIERTPERDAFTIQQGLAVRTEDLQELMLKHEPQIVHFCGHGSGEEGLVLQDGAKQPVAVATEALSRLFGLCKAHVDCVVLNACYSEVQAVAIVEHVDYAIGMQQTIRDDAAQHFAQGFYRALGYGKSVEAAYEWGCNAIQLMLASGAEVRRRDSAVPQRRKISRTAEGGVPELPEYLKPRLFKRAGLGAVEVAAVAQPSGAELAELGQALEQEDALEQYREKVREFLADHELSAFEEIRLRQFQRRLGLSEREAAQILAEEEAPLKEAREDYEEMLVALVEAGAFPFDEATLGELGRFREQLRLTAGEVARIEGPVLAAAEEMQARERLFEFETVRVDAAGKVAERQRRSAERFVEDLGNGVELEMVRISAGKFTMGSPESEIGRDVYGQFVDDLKGVNVEGPQHEVMVSEFWLGKFAVTQAQYEAVMGENPANFKGAQRPVEQVSWEDAQAFCKKLSERAGREYRLPSEAEWEYACRAGTTTPFYFGETISTDLVNYRGQDWEIAGTTYPGKYGQGQLGSFREQTTDVGSFSPNGFGLYDMHGNVWEWCADRWHSNYEGAPTDESAWVTASNGKELYVLRGGSWLNAPRNCRSAYRDGNSPSDRDDFVGFRVACVAPRAV